jgi:hypothetical protein
MNLIISDIKSIARAPILLCALLSPLIIALLLLYGFPLLSSAIWSDDAMSYLRYYSLTAISLISSIPFIYGILFSFIHLKELHSVINNEDETLDLSTKSLLISRAALSAILSLVMILPVIYITDAVSTEGWLRSIYAAFLLAITAPFIFIFATGFERDRKGWKILFLIAVIFLITVPSGLLLHHPWNYFIFFSPFYWTGWAWVIVSPAESLVYGMISMALTAIFTVICFRNFIRNNGTD